MKSVALLRRMQHDIPFTPPPGVRALPPEASLYTTPENGQDMTPSPGASPEFITPQGNASQGSPPIDPPSWWEYGPQEPQFWGLEKQDIPDQQEGKEWHGSHASEEG